MERPVHRSIANNIRVPIHHELGLVILWRIIGIANWAWCIQGLRYMDEHEWPGHWLWISTPAPLYFQKFRLIAGSTNSESFSRVVGPPGAAKPVLNHSFKINSGAVHSEKQRCPCHSGNSQDWETPHVHFGWTKSGLLPLSTILWHMWSGTQKCTSITWFLKSKKAKNMTRERCCYSSKVRKDCTICIC